jgi:hypothetical protein
MDCCPHFVQPPVDKWGDGFSPSTEGGEELKVSETVTVSQVAPKKRLAGGAGVGQLVEGKTAGPGDRRTWVSTPDVLLVHSVVSVSLSIKWGYSVTPLCHNKHT